MQFLDCPFIDREWSSDREHIRSTFAKLVDNRVPMWLVSFVEGTRATRTKLEASREFARSRGLAETRHVQVPRTKGFTASVQGLRGHITAVYDLTIGYEEGVPTLWHWLIASTCTCGAFRSRPSPKPTRACESGSSSASLRRTT